MSSDSFQLTSAAASVYEAQKVPAIFGPLARATLGVHAVSSDDIVLDIACGTGIVSRTIRERFGNQPRVSGVDLNEGMIATARAVCARDRVEVDFHVGDATAMHFADGEFTFMICQQGLQYFPDEDAALAEFRRVAADRCRCVFTVWNRPNPFFVALADALRANVGSDVADQSLAPFSWAGAGTILERMDAAGYVDVALGELTVDRVLVHPAESIPREIMANPVGPAVAERGSAVLDAVVADTIAATARFRRGDQLIIPQHTYLVSARAS